MLTILNLFIQFEIARASLDLYRAVQDSVSFDIASPFTVLKNNLVGNLHIQR